MHLESKTTTGTFHTCLISNRNHLLNKQVCISNMPPQATKKRYSSKSTKLPTNDTLKLKNITTPPKKKQEKVNPSPIHDTYIQLQRRFLSKWPKEPPKTSWKNHDSSCGIYLLEGFGSSWRKLVYRYCFLDDCWEKINMCSRIFFKRSFTKICGFFFGWSFDLLDANLKNPWFFGGWEGFCTPASRNFSSLPFASLHFWFCFGVFFFVGNYQSWTKFPKNIKVRVIPLFDYLFRGWLRSRILGFRSTFGDPWMTWLITTYILSAT